MTRERWAFLAAALALWLLFFVQALDAPVLLDDWFQLRYWRDHELGASALWAYWHHNYFHYNPRIGDVLLAIIDSSRAIHLIATPLVQIAALVTTFVIALGRWPRAQLRDLHLLLFLQVMIWLVIPISGIIYFYRPIATNYLWAFTLTLALFVPYRLALARADSAPPRRRWLVPIMLVLGWGAGMCNEHTGPTAMVVMAAFVYAAARRQQLRAWMVSGLVGLYIGYPMLFFAPGQSARYAGLATRDTPSKLLADRGLTGCLQILIDFVYESRLGIALFVAVLVRYLFVVRRAAHEPLSRAAMIAAVAGSIVVTLFMSPMATDRVFYASGVLLAAAFTAYAEPMLAVRRVRHLVAFACVVLFAYHAARFIDIYAGVKAENDERLAILERTPPGAVAYVPVYAHAQRTRWHLGDDFEIDPWLATYVGTELYDLSAITMIGKPPQRSPRSHPTYREWLTDPTTRAWAPATIAVTGLAFRDPRPVLVADHGTYVDGWPYDDSRGHFIRIQPDSLPAHLQATFVLGCGEVHRVLPLPDAAGILLPVDERQCRGVFTAIMCEPDRCWIAGWY